MRISFKRNKLIKIKTKMKKAIILSLIAIFVAATSMTAQTKTVTKTATKTATTMPCCKGKTPGECKNMTPAEKAKCKKDAAKTCTKAAPAKK